MEKGSIAAEPLNLILASLGHPDSHEAVRKLTLLSEAQGQPLQIVMWQKDLIPYLERMTPTQRRILEDPTSYRGIANVKALAIAREWSERLLRIPT